MMNNKEYIAKVTTKGQITIPKHIREKMKLNTGDYIVFKPTKSKLEIEKAFVSPEEDVFDKLGRKIEEKFKNKGINENDIKDAIKWAREEL